MLFGSLSALIPDALGLVRSTVETLGFCGSVAAPPGGVAPGFCSSVGVVLQAPTKSASVVAVTAAIRIARMACLLSFDERTPGGLAHVAGGNAQSLLDAPVGRNRREHAAVVDHGGE